MKSITAKNIRPADLDVWVLAGQSNMEGVGDLCDAPPLHPRVWAYYMDGRWDVAQDPLHDLCNSCAPVDLEGRRNAASKEAREAGDEAVRQYWAERNGGEGVGPGIAFGSAMAEASGRPIGLIAASHGGASLEQWSHTRKVLGMHSLYGAMLERIRRAGGNLKGILWYQGESDATSQAVSATYQQRLTDWIAALRADTGRADLPVLIVQIGRCFNADNPELNAAWNRVQYALAEIPAHVPATAVTSAVDLAMIDKIHLNTHGQIRLGKRLARLALRLVEGRTDIAAGPQLETMERLPDKKRGRGVVRLHFSGVTGKLLPEDDMTGFLVKGADGLPIQTKGVYNVRRDPEHDDAILVHCEGPMQPGDTLVYGFGRAPICNVRDEVDMPLCAFECPVLPGSSAAGTAIQTPAG